MLAVIFSLAFVSWQPGATNENESAGRKSASSTAADTSDQAATALPEIPLAETSLTDLDQAVPANEGASGETSSTSNGVASATSNSSRVKTANPQQATKKSSTPNSASPQTASSVRQFISGTQPINVQTHVSVPSLTNLLGY